MKTFSWRPGRPAGEQVESLIRLAATPGAVIAHFGEAEAGEPLAWGAVEPLTASRAVTVAVIDGLLAAPAVGVALCCDLVIGRAGAVLELEPPGQVPPADLLWAAGRAGPRALRVVLLGPDERLDVSEAAELGLVHRVVATGEPLPDFGGFSPAALTAARDLLRASRGGGVPTALELAVFRFLFAVGDPGEGARAFLERRGPVFSR